MTAKRYAILDHTADTGLELAAATVDELFESAAEGMFSILTDTSRVSARERITVEVTAENYEDLLLNWLQELLYIFSERMMLLSGFSVRIRAAGEESLLLHARCGGEPVDPEKHEIYAEIKTATYHRLSVKQTSAGWRGRVIFDI